MDNTDSVRKELKIRALLEKITQLTTNYENSLADARVEVTILTDTLNRVTQELEDLKGQLENNVSTQEDSAEELAEVPD